MAGRLEVEGMFVVRFPGFPGLDGIELLERNEGSLGHFMPHGFEKRKENRLLRLSGNCTDDYDRRWPDYKEKVSDPNCEREDMNKPLAAACLLTLGLPLSADE